MQRAGRSVSGAAGIDKISNHFGGEDWSCEGWEGNNIVELGEGIWLAQVQGKEQ